MAYQYDDPHSQMQQAQQARAQNMGQLRRTAGARAQWTDDTRKKMERDIRKAKLAQDAEARRKSSNWLNWSLLGTAVGSAFGMPWLGAGLGTLAGMGKAHASGGDIFDFRSQLKYLDPQMATGAAMGIGGMPPGKAGAITQAAQAVGVPGQPTASGRQFGEDPMWETKLKSTWGMSPAETDSLATAHMLRGGHLEARKRLMDRSGPPKQGGGY